MTLAFLSVVVIFNRIAQALACIETPISYEHEGSMAISLTIPLATTSLVDLPVSSVMKPGYQACCQMPWKWPWQENHTWYYYGKSASTKTFGNATS